MNGQAVSPASPAQAIRLEGHICEGQQFDQGSKRRDVRVTIIRGGASTNGYYYNEDALRAIANLVENAQAYVDHAGAGSDSQVRSVRDMVGFYTSPAYLPPDGVAQHGRVDATLHILESAAWLWSMVCEACSLGHPELIGLSIDIYGTWQFRGGPQEAGISASSKSTALPLKEVTRVLSLNSCDIVTRPSAGGAFQHILQSITTSSTPHLFTPQGAILMNELQDITSAVATDNMPGPQATGGPGASSGQTAIASPNAMQPALPASSPAGEQVQEQESRSLLEELRMERAQLALERRLLESILPEPVKAQIRSRYAGRIFEMAELERDLSLNRQMLAELATSGLIRGHNYEKPAIGSQITEAEKIQAAFDRMFDLDIDAKFGNIRPFASIREAYARVTGDASVAGFSDRSQLGMIQIAESAPLVRISEADTTTASFSYLLGTSMNKRLLKDYQAWPAEWQRFVTITPIKDFKQQTRVRLGAFGSLSTVAEDTPYTTISLTDSAATYVPTKRGNLVTVSREAIINDDLFAIKQIPTKLAVAAAYTLAEFVYGFLSANPTIYDGSALFTSGAPHNNLGSSALSTSAMQSGVTAMREQTNFAGKRLGLRPSFLIVPPELEWTAMVATKSAGVPGSNNNDINPMMGYVTPIVSPQLVNTSQWFFAADPHVVDTIEIGFVGGQVNPALFVQDMPLYGLNFTQDVISYKCRHEYGGCVVDFRGLYRGI
ncbi:MAG TPA: Mu-like prophage major head subunit gpT family protein [Ktedonobacteraceae bacterium]|jgi:hypothetical protein|nr:Mu-like prophage major head subunit gpT family protein [Ktedonobacteraceae bacterium]